MKGEFKLYQSQKVEGTKRSGGRAFGTRASLVSLNKDSVGALGRRRGRVRSWRLQPGVCDMGLVIRWKFVKFAN